MFYSKAVRTKLSRHSFLKLDMLIPSMILLFHGYKLIHIALLVTIFDGHYIHPYQINMKDHVTMPTSKAMSRELTCVIILTLINFVTCILLLLSGDIEIQPGPRLINQNDIFSVMHLNICSVRKYKNALEIEADKNKYDIITLSETLLSKAVPNEKILLPGYNPPIRKDRDDAWGGVAIYTRSTAICKERPDMNIPGLEAVWVESKIGENIILVGSFYRPPDSPVAYWNLIDESIKKAANTPHRFIVLGDFNEDPWDNTSPHLARIIEENGLVQLVKDPTRITSTTSRCIDLIFTNSRDYVNSVSVDPPIGSDHHIICANLKSDRTKNNYIKKMVMNFSKLDKNKLLQELRHIDFISIVRDNPIDTGANLLSESLVNAAKLCMPFRTYRLRENSPPWINDYILIIREHKNVIHIVAKRINTAESWENFRKIRNFYTEEIRNRKQNYISELDNSISKTNTFGTKEWWKIVNNFLKNKGSDNDTIPPIENETGTIYSNSDKAEAFNKYFNEQAKVMGNNDPLPHIDPRDETFLPFQLSTEEVTLAINNLDKNKAVGPDMVHNRLLIVACPVIVQPLTTLFNKSLANGLFPEVWKRAHVVPIYKQKGDKSSCKNYRPISLLSCVGKLLEKCVQKHLVHYLKENSIITPSQSGFTSGDSTIYQLLNIYDDFVSGLDRNIPTQAIFFDISKAFDRVWHRGLIHKLEAAGVRGTLLNWFENYLKNRKQAVVLKGSKSKFLEVHAGVPQGSVLGPTLFLLYINDLNTAIESNIKLFADDTSMYLSLVDNLTRSRILNSDMMKISLWAQKWKVNFNCQKTELLNVCNRNFIIDNQLIFDNSILQPSISHKHLGLTLQENCKWDSHVTSLVAKCRPLVSCLKSYKYRLNRRSLEIMYKSYILPHFDYADVVWDNLTQRQIQDLEEIQLEALRTIIGTVRGTSHDVIYNESGFIPLRIRRERHKLILFFKFVNGLLPTHLSRKFPELASNFQTRYPRRRSLERKQLQWNLEIYHQSYFPISTELWNNLPENIKSITSISAFKRFLNINDPAVPSYFYLGDRVPQIIHCKLRINMSDLQSDMFSRHISNNRNCNCGFQNENANHFLLHCPLYLEPRNVTIFNLPPLARKSKILLNGHPNFSLAFNSYIILTVQEFIHLSGRFEVS